jgi:hypothetical protein
MNSEPFAISAVPTNVITGFLGVGKTTAILNLLKSKPDRGVDDYSNKLFFGGRVASGKFGCFTRLSRSPIRIAYSG